jgi:hypothetical protein
MELKNLNNLKDEIAYLEEAEELLQAIYSIYGHYELWDKLNKDVVYKNEHLAQKLESHFNFDDSK